VAKRRTKRTRAGDTVASPAAGAETAALGLRYIESSALVAALLERDATALAAVRAEGRRMTSALTIAETGRAILRARAAGRLSGDQERALVRALRRLERRFYVVAVSDAILARVRRAFPVEPIRTLDAVHLATAELLGEPPPLVTIVTRDARVRDNARALGYAVE
jgi:uncharacterized protein